MTDKFCIKISNNDCSFRNILCKCINKLHPDYDPWETPVCEFEKCPLKGKYLPLSDEEKEIFEEGHKIEMESLKIISERNNDFDCDSTSSRGSIIGMIMGAIVGVLLFGPVGFIIFAILGMMLGDETEKEIIKYYNSR